MVNYYGWYSNRSRGERKKKEAGELNIRPMFFGAVKSLGSWRRFIKMVYEVDPLICPHCSKEMKVVSMIDAPDVVFKIIHHIDLLDRDQEWKNCGVDPPKMKAAGG